MPNKKKKKEKRGEKKEKKSQQGAVQLGVAARLVEYKRLWKTDAGVDVSPESHPVAHFINDAKNKNK